MGIFDGIGDLTTSNKGEYLNAGEYVIEVQAVKLINSVRTANEFFIVEFNVIEARGEGSTPPNTAASWCLKMGGLYPDSALKDINRFFKAATGAEDADINAAFVDQALSNDGEALVNMRVRVGVHMKPTSNGGDFSVHTWRPPIESGDDVPF
tara:strand:- start:190 stop:645 length:456 start_codon:yes stop_codon:yes gene_type:complete